MEETGVNVIQIYVNYGSVVNASPLSTSPTIVDQVLRGSGWKSHATVYISLGAEGLL